MVARISSAPFTMQGVVPQSWMNHLPTFSLQIQKEGRRQRAGRQASVSQSVSQSVKALIHHDPIHHPSIIHSPLPTG